MGKARAKLKAKLKKAKKRIKKLEAALAAPKGPLVSPLAPAQLPDLPEIGGVRFATSAAGVKYQGRADVMLAEIAAGSSIAGVFTRSSTCSGAVTDCREKLAQGFGPEAMAILVNSGNANAFTGNAGRASVDAISEAVGHTLGVPAGHVLTSSTGVIGEVLPHDRIIAKLTELQAGLKADGMAEAAHAIMTTDTFPKAATTSVSLDGHDVQIAGIAKGSGMIAPDMATMLVYIFTDAMIEQTALQTMVTEINAETFNAITVDNDTSTSDTLLVAATGRAGNGALSPEGQTAFKSALSTVMKDLALQVVRDGEGATKLVEVEVTGAESAVDARKVASAIANSPLVKTAIAGEDPNWGRIVMAVGKSGAKADRDRLAIRFGDILVAENGWVAASYAEELGAAYMKGDTLTISVDLGLGESAATMWTCDLTYRYVEINADYRS